GPTKDAAVLETSKCDTKEYLEEIGVPVPEYEIFDDSQEAKEWAEQWYDEHDVGLVPKADGIAAGKGAFVTSSLEDTKNAIDTIMGENFNEKYDGAGERIEIEERLEGDELSFFAITDGETVKPFGTARDYKRRFGKEVSLIDKYFDGINPNTGGMGAYSPVVIDEELEQQLMREIIEPTVQNLDRFERADDEYRGVLHLVTMVTDEGPKVLEFNVRDGDPEAQARLPRLQTDTYELFSSVTDQTLNEIEMKWSDEDCVAVCAVSGPPYKDHKRIGGGYPGNYQSKQPIFPTGNPDSRIGREGIATHVRSMVYHNGTGLEDSNGNEFIQSRGGRVLTITATADSFEEAREQVYSDLDNVHFPYMAHRDDIAEEVA
ncbi:MAG: phosphoribosylamine--glycine ligase, partial [Candidatus Nanohaloarchaea archaeon]|nr:phosphoribosylamine--glycine ligase [Candidatus Nanohaloarchaea archaeon]